MVEEKAPHGSRCFDHILIAIFLAAICVPMVVQLMSTESALSVDEKRELAQRPNVPASFDEVLGFPEAFTIVCGR